MAKEDSFTALTVAGGEGIGVPATSSDPGVGFGSWRTPSSERPVLLKVDVLVETDGASSGDVKVEVDEDGGSTPDYSVTSAFAGSSYGAGATDQGSSTILLPPGSSYQYRNVGDPNTNNTIQAQREFEL